MRVNIADRLQGPGPTKLNLTNGTSTAQVKPAAILAFLPTSRTRLPMMERGFGLALYLNPPVLLFKRLLIAMQDQSSSWNGQPMLRSELIPQTSEDLGSGRLIYHFSLQTREKNAPTGDVERQIAFFEVSLLSVTLSLNDTNTIFV